MHTRWARLARGWVAAGFATFVAGFSHVVAGGEYPSVFAFVVSLVISGTLCTLLAGRRLSLVRLSVSVAASQALFHGLFSSLGTPTMVEHSHDQMVVASSHGHATMWGAHAVAALVTIVALRYGEVAFWGLAHTARMFLVRLVRWLAPTALPLIPRILGEAEAAPPRQSPHLVLPTLRGPPREFAF